MRSTFLAFYFQALKKNILIPISLISLAATFPATATTIDFDDLNPVYDELSPCWCDNPLTDEYSDQGLLIHDAWVSGGDGQNVLLTSNYSTLEFIGALPTFLSMNVTSLNSDAIYLDVYGPTDFLFSILTSGWQGREEVSTTPIIDEYISITAPEGISFVGVGGFYNLRLGATIDNLNFTYSNVPEPPPILILTLGLLGILARKSLQPKR